MKRPGKTRVLCAAAAVWGLMYWTAVPVACADQPRTAWATPRITGSPEPPPKYQQVLRYPRLKFQQPLYINADPAGQRMWVATRSGKIWSFADRDDVAAADLFFDFRDGYPQLTPHATATKVNSTLGMAFHPNYPAVPLCWIVYTVKTNKGSVHLDDGTRLSRFRVTFEGGVPRCDPGSERILMTWLEGGHNGGCVKFGPDGCLYVSAGDGEVPNPPDPRRCGQDVTNVMSTIVRLDVSVDDDGPAYRIPADNPFASCDPAADAAVDRELFYAKSEARPEIWAYGFRNPWRFNFSADGQLWAGDVGWELYEMVYNVKPGANYGWSVFEGPQQVLPENKRGPTPIVPPALSYSHAEGASVTGGVFYKGRQLPELSGRYIFGDYETRRIWSAKITPNASGGADELSELTDLVEPSVRIVSFGEDTSGEPLLLHFDEGTVYGLTRNHAPETDREFPRRLSETGLFTDVSQHLPAVGVVPFHINEPLWSDGAVAQRLVALPGTAPLKVLPKPRRRQTSSLRETMEFPEDAVLARTVSLTDNSGQSVRLETQVLHYNGKVWNPYSYVWNAAQTDATLAPAAGQTIDLSAYGQFERQQWSVASRSECVRCHNSWVGGVLAFSLPQLNTSLPGGNQLQAMIDGDWFSGAIPETVAESDDPAVRALACSADESAPLAERARAYLAVNCSHCHQKGAGGTATIDLRHVATLTAMQTVDAAPMQGTFQIDHPAIVKPGDPSRSVLLYRVRCSGRGRMPHIGSQTVDTVGVDVIRRWIAQLPGDGAAVAKPGLTSTAAAMTLVSQLEDGTLEQSQQQQWLAQARRAAPEIRNLFVRFQPAEYRRTLSQPDPSRWTTMKGDPVAGQQVFATKSVQCASCHRVHGQGGQIGPALDDVGQRLTRPQIVEAILEPSKKIDPRYVAWTAVTADGKVHSGLLVERTEQQIVLRSSRGEDIAIARDDLDELIRQTTSLMPDRLLDDLTDQQVVDLLAWMQSLKGSAAAP